MEKIYSKRLQMKPRLWYNQREIKGAKKMAVLNERQFTRIYSCKPFLSSLHDFLKTVFKSLYL